MGWSQFSLKASVLCCCGLVMVIFVDGSLTKCTSLKGNVEDCANRGFTHIPTHFDFLSLNLEQNAITTLLADQFIRYPFLQSMNLQSNFIAEIETGALNGLSDLKVLNLSSNRLEHLPGYIFSPLRSLLHLDLSRNALRTISSEAFANLWSLQTLSLSDNRITNLDKVRFIDLQNLTTLRLERNELITLDNSVTASLPQLSFLFLQDNPLQCSCSLRSLLIWSAGSGRFLHGADCATPPSLSGRNLKELLELDLTCIAPRIDSVKVSDKIVVEGDTITFSCSATGYPKPVIYWTNPEGVILWPDGDHIHNKPYKSHENGTVTVTYVHSNDSGTFVCTTENAGGSDRAEVNVDVLRMDAVKFSTSELENSSYVYENETRVTSTALPPMHGCPPCDTTSVIVATFFGTFFGTLILCAVLLYLLFRHLSKSYNPSEGELDGDTSKKGGFVIANLAALLNLSAQRSPTGKTNDNGPSSQPTDLSTSNSVKYEYVGDLQTEVDAGIHRGPHDSNELHGDKRVSPKDSHKPIPEYLEVISDQDSDDKQLRTRSSDAPSYHYAYGCVPNRRYTGYNENPRTSQVVDRDREDSLSIHEDDPTYTSLENDIQPGAVHGQETGINTEKAIWNEEERNSLYQNFPPPCV